MQNIARTPMIAEMVRMILLCVVNTHKQPRFLKTGAGCLST